MSIWNIKYSGLDTKTKAIYGKRLRFEDYKNLKNMKTVPEIAAYLKKHPGYFDVLQGVRDDELHRDQLEEILHNELTKEFARLMNFVQGKDKRLLYCMVIHLETDQILDFVRGLISHREPFSTKVLPEIKKRSEIDFDKLKKAQNLAQLIDGLQGSRYYFTLKPFLRDEQWNYTGIEVALRSQYFQYILKEAEKLASKKDGQRIREFVGGQIDITNFTRILRCKRFFAMKPDSIVANLLPLTYRLDKKQINAMVNALNWQDAYNMILQTCYQGLFQGHDYDMVEQYYYEYIWEMARKFLFHCQNSICVPYAYLNVKQIEIKNLVNIIEGVRYQVESSALNKHLIGVTI